MKDRPSHQKKPGRERGAKLAGICAAFLQNRHRKSRNEWLWRVSGVNRIIGIYRGLPAQNSPAVNPLLTVLGLESIVLHCREATVANNRRAALGVFRRWCRDRAAIINRPVPDMIDSGREIIVCVMNILGVTRDVTRHRILHGADERNMKLPPSASF